MIELLALGGLLLVGLLIFGVVALVFSVLKLTLLIVFLPIRLFLKLLFFPVKLLLGLLLLPLVGLGLVLALIAAVVVGMFALVVPLAPFLLLGLVVWLIVKAGRKPAPIAS